MKYVMIGMFFLSSCASVSPYNQGCRDGMEVAINALKAKGYPFRLKPDGRDKVCSDLDNNRELMKHNSIPGKGRQ